MPTTIGSEITLAPTAETQTSAKRICGMAIVASAVLIKNSSTHPRRTPAIRPQVVPIRSAIAVAAIAMRIVIRPP